MRVGLLSCGTGIAGDSGGLVMLSIRGGSLLGTLFMSSHFGLTDGRLLVCLSYLSSSGSSSSSNSIDRIAGGGAYGSRNGHTLAL